MSGNLTEEQLRRIEENKKKALAKRAEKLAQSPLKQKPVLDKPKINVGISPLKQNPAEARPKISVGISYSRPPSVVSRINSNNFPTSERNSNLLTGTINTTLPTSARNTDLSTSGRSNLHVNTSVKCNTGDTSNTVLKSNTDCVGPGPRESHTFSVNVESDNSSRVKLKVGINSPSAKIHVGIEQKSALSNICTSSNPSISDRTNVVNEQRELSVQERIEQNRLKALEKLAEKKKSPAKPIVNSSDIVPLYSTHKTDQARPTSSKTLISSINKASSDALNNKSSSGPANQQSSSMSHDGTEVLSSSKNIFSTVGHKPVKGSCVLISRDRFEVNIGFSAPLVQLFKTMETKLYDAVTKKWSFKLSEYLKFMSAVKSLHPSVEVEPLPKAILQVFGPQAKGSNIARTPPTADLSKVEPSLVNSLMSFQREGVNFGIWKNGRVLIADDMGLGKTIQAICLACYYRDEWPLLIVVPSSVRFDWAQQFQRWVPSLDPQQINVATTGKDSCTSGLINILSYDLMAKKGTALRDKHYQVVIMDECHLLKNYNTARCKAAMPLLQNSRRVLLLSGTPALSRPSELYTQICAVCPFLFKFHDFGVRYCDGKQHQWGWDFSGSSNMAELQLLLEEKIMIRRLKKDVLQELPDKVRQMVLLDPRSIKVDKDLKKASKVLSSSKLKGMEQRGALLEFFHQSGKAKLAAVRTYVEDLLEGDRKFIIFAHHQEVLDGIEDVVKNKIDTRFIRIDGRTNSEQRNYLCKKFQHNDDISVAILSITAANAGINLSAASLVVFAELFWNPGILVQAEDRAHRLGQQDSVSVHYLVATGTSDDHIWPMIQKKLDVLGKAGLTRDDFSSADTTHIKDPRQEEIIRFLEESFSEEFGADNTMGCDVDEEITGESEFKGKEKTSRQISITKFCSPMKDIPKSSKPQESTTSKPRGLFKYFSSVEKETDNDPGLNDNGDHRESNDGGNTGQGSEARNDCDNEIDMFLSDNEDIFDEIREPQQKKQRT